MSGKKNYDWLFPGKTLKWLNDKMDERQSRLDTVYHEQNKRVQDYLREHYPLQFSEKPHIQLGSREVMLVAEGDPTLQALFKDVNNVCAEARKIGEELYGQTQDSLRLCRIWTDLRNKRQFGCDWREVVRLNLARQKEPELIASVAVNQMSMGEPREQVVQVIDDFFKSRKGQAAIN